MIPAFETPSVTVYCGDALSVLRELPDGSVDCIVTSPPYFRLRDYGVVGQIGLEDTPAEYVAAMVGVFRAVRRVLSDAGTLWLNLGDSYAGSWCAQGRTGQMSGRSVISARQIEAHPRKSTRTGAIPTGSGLKPKDLIGIPWRVAFALQEDGWYLRSDIIWAKPNPMPESVTDRPTKSHEYVFLLSKNERYAYDADAIRELLTPSSIARLSQNVEAQEGSHRVPGKTNGTMKAVYRSGNKARTDRPGLADDPRNQKGSVPWEDSGVGRNARSVWTIATQPYAAAHFATFPRELPRRAILAGCPAGGVVLDPFAGSGTTLEVAQGLGRRAIGIELNPEYVRLIEKRCAQTSLGIPA